MTAETEAELADALAAFDPECFFRLVCLALAHYSDKTGNQEHIVARAQSNYDFTDPFAMKGDKFPLHILVEKGKR